MRGVDNRVLRPIGSLRGWAWLGGLGSPVPQALEDAPHRVLIVDQGNDAHQPLTLGAFTQNAFVELADEPRRYPNLGPRF